MGARVLAVCSLRADLGMMAQSGHLVLADLRHPDAIETALSDIGRDTDRVIVTCEAAHKAEVTTILTKATVRFPELRAALIVVPATPLAVQVISEIISRLDSEAAQIAQFDSYLETSWAGLWTPTVAKLSYPSPPFGAHLRSFLPSSSFIVSFAPDTFVVPATPSTIESLPSLAGSVLFHSAASEAAPLSFIAESLGAADLVLIESPREAIDLVGDSSAVEFLALIDNPDDVSHRVEHACECPACGVVQPRLTCPWCKMTRAAAPREASEALV